MGVNEGTWMVDRKKSWMQCKSFELLKLKRHKEYSLWNDGETSSWELCVVREYLELDEMEVEVEDVDELNDKDY